MSNYGEVIMAEMSTRFKWIVQYSDCCKLTKGKKLISPIFTTIINNTEHNWRFIVRPWILPNYLAFSVQNLTKNNVEVTIELSIQNMDNVENKRKTSTENRPLSVDGYSTWVLKRSVIENKANNLLANGAFTILCQIIQDECDQSMFTSRSENVHGFETLLDDEKYSNVKFTVDNKIIKAHKCILAKKSDVFATMFEHDTIEKKQNVVEITDTRYDVLKEMLRFLYSGKINNMEKIAADLLPVADKYLLQRLKTKCEEFLSLNLNDENVIACVGLADTYNDNVLKNKAIQFIVSNAEKVMDKPELKNLSQSHPEDHIQEVLDKWNQIDDEIWAKVIVFERNRRVAKAYARAPVLTVNGSNDGFDGFRIGLCGFDNPMRDNKTEEAKRHINQGVKIKMDEQGNILIKRLCKSNVYVKATNQEDNAIGAEIIRNSQGAVEHEKPGKLFDMNKFQTNLSRETRRAYPDRRRLETQCLSAIVFVRMEADILQCPVWVLIVNVVGLDMLKSKLPPVLALQRPVDIKNRPRIPIPDEDPYSVAGVSTSSGPSDSLATSRDSRDQIYVAYQQQKQEQQQLPPQQRQSHRRGERPPKLPPRENLYGHDIPKPDYDDIEDDYMPSSVRAPVMEEKKSKKENNKKYDDPYYCGLRARVPNFVKMAKSNGHAGVAAPVSTKIPAGVPVVSPATAAAAIYGHTTGRTSQHHHHHHHQVATAYNGQNYPIVHSQSSQIYGHHVVPAPAKRPPIMYHARSFESGLDSDDRIDSPYNHIYGRLPIPTRGMIPPAPRAMFIGEWD